MTDTLVRVAVADGVRTLTLDSQHNRNALSAALVEQLLDGIRGAADDPDSRVVVIEAEGRAFCAGADLSEMTGDVDAARARGTQNMLDTFSAIVGSPCPVVAKVHAAARAGGIGIVAAADIAVASTSATFSLTEVKLGLAPAIISLVVGPRMHDRARSRTWLTGEVFDGARAAELGLVTEACAPEELDATTDAIVAELAAAPGQGLAETKKLLNAPLLADIEARGQELGALSARLFGTDEARRAMLAFLSRGKG